MAAGNNEHRAFIEENEVDIRNLLGNDRAEEVIMDLDVEQIQELLAAARVQATALSRVAPEGEREITGSSFVIEEERGSSDLRGSAAVPGVPQQALPVIEPSFLAKEDHCAPAAPTPPARRRPARCRRSQFWSNTARARRRQFGDCSNGLWSYSFACGTGSPLNIVATVTAAFRQSFSTRARP